MRFACFFERRFYYIRLVLIVSVCSGAADVVTSWFVAVRVSFSFCQLPPAEVKTPHPDNQVEAEPDGPVAAPGASTAPASRKRLSEEPGPEVPLGFLLHPTRHLHSRSSLTSVIMTIITIIAPAHGAGRGAAPHVVNRAPHD